MESVSCGILSHSIDNVLWHGLQSTLWWPNSKRGSKIKNKTETSVFINFVLHVSTFCSSIFLTVFSEGFL